MRVKHQNYYLVILKMQRQAQILVREQSNENKRNMSLPTIDHFKLMSRVDKSNPTNPIVIAQRFPIDLPFDFPANETSKASIFNMPRDILHANHKTVITQNKTQLPNKDADLPSTSTLKKRIQQLTFLQKDAFYNQNQTLNEALCEFGLLNKSQTIVNDKRLNHYLPQRKLSQKKKGKLKPILNDMQQKSNQLSFINVQRKQIYINDNKKSKSILLRFPLDVQTQDSLFTKKSQKQIQIKSNPLIKQHPLEEKQLMTINQRFHNSIGKKSVNDSPFSTVVINTFEPKLSTKELFVRRQSLLHTLRTHKPKLQVQTVSEKETNVEQPSIQPKPKVVLRYTKRFQPPYPTYHYRNLLWKVNLTNQIFVEPLLQYQHKVKAFVGKGNNSCMVSGLINRRPWFAITDKLQEANFVWTQLKQLSFFKKQASLRQANNPPHQIKENQYKTESIMTLNDQNNFKAYFKMHLSSQQHADQRMLPRLKYFKYKKIIKASQIFEKKMQNHFKNNYILGNKKALFNTMSNYYFQRKQDVFEYLPLTFHIKQGLQDQKYYQFLKYYHKRSKKAAKNNEDKSKKKEYNAWIIKPGENSNRGNGIKMCLTLDQIKTILKRRDRYHDGTYRTYIVQAYIERPLLYFKRKFDLRHYMMITCINGLIKGYWYKDGYVRTTSSEYSLKDNSGSIHLTNDAVQKNLADYGKYQKGNKLSYEQLSAYIDKYHKQAGKGFYESIYPKMKVNKPLFQKIGTDSIRASSGGIDPQKLENNFQVFGLDFMIDSNLDVWLIEINTNPCLELSCPLLGCIIPKMVQNALQLTMDAIFPPPVRFTPKGLHYFKELQKENRFQLVYDQRMQTLYQDCLTNLDNKLLEEEEDTFQDCGQNWQDS